MRVILNIITVYLHATSVWLGCIDWLNVTVTWSDSSAEAVTALGHLVALTTRWQERKAVKVFPVRLTPLQM